MLRDLVQPLVLLRMSLSACFACSACDLISVFINKNEIEHSKCNFIDLIEIENQHLVFFHLDLECIRITDLAAHELGELISVNIISCVIGIR